MKRKLFLSTVLFFFISFSVFAIEPEDVIFTKNIWLSKNIFFDGEKIRIYSEFKNDQEYDVEQTIEFYDNDEKIGEKNIEIASKKKVIIWIDNIFKKGTHRIITKIKNSKKDDLDGKKDIIVKDTRNIKIITIDRDTDGDGLGDSEDLDDDNDGFSDVEEIAKNTDPRSKLSTPLTVDKLKTQFIKEKNNNILYSLKDILNEKRIYFEKQLGQSIQDKKKEKLFLKTKVESDARIETNRNELELINKYKNKDNFNRKTEEKENILKKTNSIEGLKKEVLKEILFLDSKKMTKDERDFSKACLFKAKYKRINEIIEEKNSENLLSKIWYYILNILWFIFKNTYLTIIFLIFIFWFIWKIIKKF